MSRYEVRETIVIHAPPERIWPLLVSIPRIGPSEGRWNATHNLLGVPRPTQALLEARGPEVVRLAHWGPDIRFEEHILEVSDKRSLRWTFVFPDTSVRDHTDRHIAPDGMHLTIREGSYHLTPLPGGRTEVALETSFDLRSPVNWYAAGWGEWLLRDIQGNVLQIIKDRVESPPEAREGWTPTPRLEITTLIRIGRSLRGLKQRIDRADQAEQTAEAADEEQEGRERRRRIAGLALLLGCAFAHGSDTPVKVLFSLPPHSKQIANPDERPAGKAAARATKDQDRVRRCVSSPWELGMKPSRS
jgi:hypothetical protein